MAGDVFTTLGAQALALFLYPGLLFIGALALVGEWLAARVRPLLAPRLLRTPLAHYGFLQPLYDAFKLAGRLPSDVGLGNLSGWPGLAAIAAPLLATLLMPVPGSPLAGRGGTAFDLFTVLILLAVQPLVSAALMLRGGGLTALHGGLGIGRLVTGLLPALLSVAALAEVSTSRSLQLGSMTAAPETASQTLVRLLAGGVLLFALPWWAGGETDLSGGGQAGLGRLFQQAALAVLWAVLVLPAPGDLFWALALVLPGAALAYVAMRLLPMRWYQARNESGFAGLIWSATVPAAFVALVVALWSGA